MDGWGCSLADRIETELGTPLAEFIADNYAELAELEVINEQIMREVGLNAQR